VPLNLDLIDTPEALADLAPAWSDLCSRDPAATPFHTPDWLLPWTRHLWLGGRICSLAVHHGNRLVALAPMFTWGYGQQPQQICVSFLGSGITDYLGMTADPEFAAEAARLVLHWLADHRADWQICDLQELRAGSPLLETDIPARIEAVITECSVCPVAELEARLPAAFRHNLHTAGNRLRKEPEAALVQSPADELIPALFRLHQTRRREREQQGMFATDSLRTFHCEAINALARAGIARLYGLRIAGEIVAVQYNLIARNLCYLYLSRFDPRYRHVSPGMLLLRKSIRCASEEGARRLDFGATGSPSNTDGAHRTT